MPRMDYIRFLTHFSMQSEYVRVSVNVLNIMGSYRYYKLHAYEIEARNETKCQTPPMDVICALIHFEMHFESVGVDIKLSSKTGSNGTVNSTRT